MKAKWLIGALVLAAVPVGAQQVPDPAKRPQTETAVSEARFQVRIMEGVLENAVGHGAQIVSTQMRLVSPDVALFSGPPRARGFRLDGYGVFFAVDVPSLHRSVTWSVRTINQSNAELSRAIQSIRRMVQTQRDTQMKGELEQALRLVELQVGPPITRTPATTNAFFPQPASSPGSADVTAASDPAVTVSDPNATDPNAADLAVSDAMLNPSASYTDAVQRAIADAMLDYGSTLNLSGEEWLTVAARENNDTILSGDLTESVTITLRVKATDLEALRAGQLTRDEARQRVEVRAF